LWQGGVISKTSVAETFGIDLLSERDRMREEQLADMRLQKEVSIEQQKLQNSIAEQAKAQAQMGQVPAGLNYDQQMVIAQADQVAYQLSAMDENTRRSQLHSLQTEDYVMYSVVIQRLEQIQTEQNAQMKAQYQAQMQGQGGMAPPGAPPV
jgi:hypothetical protein